MEIDFDLLQDKILETVASDSASFSSLTAEQKILRIKEYNDELSAGAGWTDVFPFCFSQLETGTPTQVLISGEVNYYRTTFKLFIGRNDECAKKILKLISEIVNALNGKTFIAGGQEFTLQPGAINYLTRGPGGIKVYTLIIGVL